MPSKVFVYSSKYSDGAKELANALNAKRLKRIGGSWVGKAGQTLINWGGTDLSSIHPGEARILNPPLLVQRSSNKLSFFSTQAQGDAKVPQWTGDADVAKGWIDEGHIVVARTILNGHSGNGIVILEPGVDFVQAPLYTKYVKKEAEYRVHCIRKPDPPDAPVCAAFDVQRKIKDPAFEGTPNWRVRNHQNGFIYIRDNIQIPEDVTRQAVQAFAASGLDFGAVDVIWNKHESKAYVLEINTAPGLTGRTVQSYKEAFTSSFALH